MQSFVFQWFTHLQIVNSYSPKTKWTLVNIYREEEPQNNGLWLHQCWGQKISTRDRRSVQGTNWDQCKGQMLSAWDGRSVPGTGDRCLGQKISARDKRSMLRTFHGVIHELLTSILHAQTRCRSVHERGFTTGQKTLENQDWVSGLLGRRWPWVAGPSGRRATGPWWAAGRWAAGLFLENPF